MRYFYIFFFDEFKIEFSSFNQAEQLIISMNLSMRISERVYSRTAETFFINQN